MSPAPHFTYIKQLLHRRADAHKYDFGHVLVIGGSPGMTGAPLLSAEAALRSGAGLVTIATDAATADKLERRVKEIMTLRLPAEPALVVPRLASFIKERRVTVVVAGPGLHDTAFVPDLVDQLHTPVVLDAGACTVFRDKPSRLLPARLDRPVIATPHAGEFATLLGMQPVSIEQSAKAFAARFGITLVVKMPRAFVAHAQGAPYRNPTGNPGLATAGSGDVLAGIIGGLLAQGVPAPEAADVGAYLHGLAGDLAARALTQPGMIASDIVSYIPAALAAAGSAH